MIQQDSTVVDETSQTKSVGSALRDLRIARGLSLEDVSARLKYSTRQIQALEEERWDQLPSGVSLRGMIRNYARLVGADMEPIVEALSSHASVSIRPTGRDLGASAAVGGEDAPHASSVPWGWLLVILVVVIAVVAYAFWQGWLPKELLSLDGLKQRFH
ncbi:MAG TPA: helix-turn-helix transcriptional regulator [Bordetella sp.]